MTINLQTTNPEQLNDRVSGAQTALMLDELNNLARARYTAAGAITPGGVALLQTGAASAMTLAQPVAGSQLQGGNDFMRMRIVALDAHAYTVTTAANGISGASGTGDTLTCAGSVGDSVELVAFNGQWYISRVTTGTPSWALTEV